MKNKFLFQSSRSLRTATDAINQNTLTTAFQSSRSLRTATQAGHPWQCDRHISILAVLADRDCTPERYERSEQIFQSSRSLRTATGRKDPTATSKVAFQSSRSLRTETAGAYHLGTPDDNFNPRGPCGPRRCTVEYSISFILYFNPRGPCGPRPAICCALKPAFENFNPRGPCGPRPRGRGSRSSD